MRRAMCSGVCACHMLRGDSSRSKRGMSAAMVAPLASTSVKGGDSS